MERGSSPRMDQINCPALDAVLDVGPGMQAVPCKPMSSFANSARFIFQRLQIPVALGGWLFCLSPAPAADRDLKAPPSAAVAPVEAFGLKELNPRGGLPNFLAKVARGEAVSVAYLGGSITNAPGWRVLSLRWLREKYPQAKLTEIHAAVSGTGSDFGAFRLGREVLDHRPDLLFVEFAVNDSGASPDRIVRAMEGIVRQTWRANPSTDICYVYTLGDYDVKTLQGGSYPRASATMERVAEHYAIPSIHFGVEVANLAQAGRLSFIAPLPKTEAERAALGGKIVFAGDAVHPHVETGHPLYLASIQRAWPVLERVAAPANPRVLPAPTDPLNWEHATMAPIAEIRREGIWQKLPADAPPRQSAGAKTELWSASQAGAAITFRFTGRSFGLNGLKGPDAGQFRVLVDDEAPVVAAQFDAYCTTSRWRLNPWIYPRELPEGEHRVRIELLGTTPDKDKILKARNGLIEDPAQRAAANLHVSHLLILGKLLPE